MTRLNVPTPPTLSCGGRVLSNTAVSTGLIRLDLELEMPAYFAPGQFAMLNTAGPADLVFSRPFSILAVDGAVMSFLYRVVGRGTRAFADLVPGSGMRFLGPLGTPFPVPQTDRPAVLIGGGVGLPPVANWYAVHGRPGDVACFGGRDGGDVPWGLLDDRWLISVDDPRDLPDDRTAFHGRVTEMAAAADSLAGDTPRTVMACGPVPLLKAAWTLARQRGWDCFLSLEEHMGCGYGACKGCVVPVLAPADREGWRNATCCQEGPVFRAEDIAWERYGVSPLETTT